MMWDFPHWADGRRDMRKTDDTMTFRQFLLACCVSVFSPMSRLLPHAPVRIAGFSGWLAPLFAVPLLLFLLLTMHRLLTLDGRTVGLAEALELRLGRIPGKVLTGLIAAWLVFYGGFLLRSGAERLLSTVYHAGRLWFFLPVLMLLSAIFAMGKLRWAGRSAALSFLFTGSALLLTMTLAIPAIRRENIWPPEYARTGEIMLASLPVADVLSPWVYFTFLRGGVIKDGRSLRRGIRAILVMLGLAMLFLAAVIGVMGAELSVRQQFPFFIMLKNLTLFNVVERFDALVLAVWMLTDYVCIGMTLLSASEGFREVFSVRKRNFCVPICALVMMAVSFVIAYNAFSLEIISDMIVPEINLGIVFFLLPAVSLFPEKNLKKLKNRC